MPFEINDNFELARKNVYCPKRQRNRISREEWTALQEHRREAAKAPPRPPQIHFYRRCSGQNSADSGLGLDDQETQMNAYWEACARHLHPHLEKGPLWSDIVVSARKYQLLARPQAAEMNSALRRGDHVCFARLDRAFRDLRDCLNMIEFWRERGITVHFADLRLDLDTPMGVFTMQILGAVAQMWADATSSLVRAAIRAKMARGEPWGSVPFGKKIVGKGKSKRLVWDREAWRLGMMIVKWRDSGLSFQEVDEQYANWLHMASKGTVPPIFLARGRMMMRYYYKRFKRWMNKMQDGKLPPADESLETARPVDPYANGRAELDAQVVRDAVR